WPTLLPVAAQELALHEEGHLVPLLLLSLEPVSPTSSSPELLGLVPLPIYV
ncbi:unnamed protein product, partial [Urochloa humidicola]